MLRKVFAAIGAAAVLTIASVPPASASSGSDLWICLVSNTSLCLDAPALSQQLQVDAGNDYSIDEIATVNTQIDWPFTPGSGWNARYAGSAVVVMRPESDLNACARTDAALNPNASAVYNAEGSACGSGTSFKAVAVWVERGNWLVNVGQTEQGPSSGVPYILQAGCASKGCSVWVNTAAANGNPNDYQWEY
jgi:hypothetical protein